MTNILLCVPVIVNLFGGVLSVETLILRNEVQG